MGLKFLHQEQYQAFKLWLIENKKLSTDQTVNAKRIIFSHEHAIESDYIAHLFAINRIIEKYISQNDDLFTLINNSNYDAIFRFRFHYHNVEVCNHL